MREFFVKHLEPIVPLYAVVPLICCFILNSLVYYGATVINANRVHYDLTLDFDRKVPVIPAFIIIYFGCYIFWITNSILIAKISKKSCMRFVFAYITSISICALLYVAMPTTNVRPEITGTGVFESLMRVLYQIDKPENLFPSIHCLLSWFCYIGLRGRKEIPKSYRIFSCIFAILVFLSTQFTKQHYIVDVFGGVIIAEVMYYICKNNKWYNGMEKIFDMISSWIFGRDNVGKNKK